MAYIFVVALLIGVFIGFPLYIYSKTVEISSKFTLTRFLIAWPLRILMSFATCIGLTLFSFIPVLLVLAVVNVLLTFIFNLPENTQKTILALEIILYLLFIINLTLVATIKNFIRESKS